MSRRAQDQAGDALAQLYWFGTCCLNCASVGRVVPRMEDGGENVFAAVPLVHVMTGEPSGPRFPGDVHRMRRP
jgi:hypothetical protein